MPWIITFSLLLTADCNFITEENLPIIHAIAVITFIAGRHTIIIIIQYEYNIITNKKTNGSFNIICCNYGFPAVAIDTTIMILYFYRI